METYIVLTNFTAQGIENIKDSPARIEQARKAVEAAGGRWIGWYLTMGRYDVVVLVELPSADAVAAMILGLSALGNVRTETLRAFTENEFAGLLENLD